LFVSIFSLIIFFRVVWEEPIEMSITEDLTILSSPPPGSGVILGFILNILKNYDIKPEDLDTDVSEPFLCIQLRLTIMEKLINIQNSAIVNIFVIANFILLLTTGFLLTIGFVSSNH